MKKTLGKRIVCVIAVVTLVIMGWFTGRIGDIVVDRGGSTLERDATVAALNGGNAEFVEQQAIKEAKQTTVTLCTAVSVAFYLLAVVPLWSFISTTVKKEEGGGETTSIS